MGQARCDVAHLVDRCPSASGVEFGTFPGVSDDRRLYPIEDAPETLGYGPQDTGAEWNGSRVANVAIILPHRVNLEPRLGGRWIDVAETSENEHILHSDILRWRSTLCQFPCRSYRNRGPSRRCAVCRGRCRRRERVRRHRRNGHSVLGERGRRQRSVNGPVEESPTLSCSSVSGSAAFARASFSHSPSGR